MIRALRRVAGSVVLASVVSVGVARAQDAPDFSGTWAGPIAGGLQKGTLELTQQDGVVKGSFRASFSTRSQVVEGAIRPDGVLVCHFDGRRNEPMEVRLGEGPTLQLVEGDLSLTFRPVPAAPPAQAPPAFAAAWDGPTTVHADAATGLTFDLPEGWKAASERGSQLVLAVEPADPAGRRQLRAFVLRGDEVEGGDLVVLVAMLGGELSRPHGNDLVAGAMTDEPHAVTVNGAAGAEASWSLTLQGDVNLAAWVGAITLSDGRVLCVGALVEGDREREDLPRARRVLASARLAPR